MHKDYIGSYVGGSSCPIRLWKVRMGFHFVDPFLALPSYYLSLGKNWFVQKISMPYQCPDPSRLEIGLAKEARRAVKENIWISRHARWLHVREKLVRLLF